MNLSRMKKISSTQSPAASRGFECETKASNTSSSHDPKSTENAVNQSLDIEPNINRNDSRKSKSKMRVYLKKCKDVLYGGNNDETCTPTVNENLPQPSTLWYLTINKIDSDQLPKAIKTNQVEEQEAIDNEIKCMTETMPLVETKVNKDFQTLSSLMDKYFGLLYPRYQENSRNILTHQARDILVTTYHCDFPAFERYFLRPAAEIAIFLKQKYTNLNTIKVWQKGWPLTLENGSLVLHLGEIDESKVRPQEFYLCIRSESPNVTSKLYAVWRIDSDSIAYHELDPQKHSITPLSIEMLAGEDLPHLLQTLLVGVEHAICRIPFDELTFPHSTESSVSDKNVIEYLEDCSIEQKNVTNQWTEQNLKRREVVKKNISNNKTHSVKRVSCNGMSSENETAELRAREMTTSTNPLTDYSTNETDSSTTGVVASRLPLFCLGGSFPHIDSDEEDDVKKNINVSPLPHDIVAPRSILDLPEKLLMSGCYLPGTTTKAGDSVIVIESDKVHQAGLNCYEIATLILFYNTIPMNSTTFVIHLTAKNHGNGHVKVVLEKLDNGLQLLHGHVEISSVLVTLTEESIETWNDGDEKYLEQLPISHTKLIYASTLEQLLLHIRIENLLTNCYGSKTHNQDHWKEFFKTIDPLQDQCLIAGRNLVAVLCDIRNTDQIQGPSTRRQLHSQHRTLCRALMDNNLQTLRRKGPNIILQLQDRVKRISTNRLFYPSSDKAKNLDDPKPSDRTTSCQYANRFNFNQHNKSEINAEPVPQLSKSDETFVEQRLNGFILLFNEVERAANRLEQLTQHHERLCEMTRQHTLEDEINEAIEWIKNEGETELVKYNSLSLECCDTIRDEEQNFEKFYFISMKHIAKGKDLTEATVELDLLRSSGVILDSDLKAYSSRLETLRENFEGAARLHHLLALELNDDDIQKEMQKLAEKIGLTSLMQNSKTRNNNQAKKVTGKMTITTKTITTRTPSEPLTSTPKKEKNNENYNNNQRDFLLSATLQPSMATIEESPEKKLDKVETKVKEDDDDDDELAMSKFIDSGLETFDESYEMKNKKLLRACSCQSMEDDTTLPCDNSHDDDDADYDTSENITSITSFEEPRTVSICVRKPNTSESSNKVALVPMQANAHLYSHASNLQLDLDLDSTMDQKTQKTLLMIIREMIETERDYVRSLYYVIDNYMQELIRDDIPQALRGQRNVIFGNIEKIHEFHQQHFLKQIEQYERYPLKVGAAFLRHESKFYLYALYNKNKPKSDSLMTEYGSAFFKSKQNELMDKMDLASYLLKPVQRMGKYALLLQQLVKACKNIRANSQELIEDLEELQKSEKMVRFQLRHGNDLLAMDSLRDCDVNVKEQGRLLRQNEFLVWCRGGKKSLRQVFLFEELVLFSKARRFPDRKNLDIYIYKNSIKTSDIGLTAFIGDSPTKFEIWFRKRKPGDTWTLQNMNEEIKHTWTEEISRLLWKQAQRGREVRMAEMSSMGIGSKPCLDIRPSIDQINDRSISFSQLVKAPKFRNSFVGTLPSKSARRPNSIISISSSASSGDSSVSSCNKTSKDSEMTHCHDHKHEKQEQTVPCKIKYSRSKTVVSQCSTESGILADFSSLSPEECLESPLWPSSNKSGVTLRKSNTSVSASSSVSRSTTSSSSSFGIHEMKSKTTENAKKSNSSSSISDVYLNENDVTVHL